MCVCVCVYVCVCVCVCARKRACWGRRGEGDVREREPGRDRQTLINVYTCVCND